MDEIVTVDKTVTVNKTVTTTTESISLGENISLYLNILDTVTELRVEIDEEFRCAVNAGTVLEPVLPPGVKINNK